MFSHLKNSKLQGNVGMAYAIAFYSKLGWIVSIPMTDSQDYDLLVDNGENILKIQVKTTTQVDKRTGNFQVGLRTCGGNRKNYWAKTFNNNSSDFLFVVTSFKEFYSIPVKELEGIRTSISLCDKYKVEL